MTYRILLHVLLAVAGLTASGFVGAAKPPRDATPAASGHVVDYAALENQVGATLIIDTEFKTSRRGTLVKYTNPALTLKLGPEAGSVELSVPRGSIRKITLVTPAPRVAPKEGDRAETH